MKISYQWLRQFLSTNLAPAQIADILSKSGLEVEEIEKYESIKGGLEGLVIGFVITCEKHPNADKLSRTTVDVGNGIILPIVCGAPNIAAGQKVVVALPGATLYPVSGGSFQIKKTKIRGEESEGMICAEDEIGLGTSHEGIMVLHTELTPGTPAAQYFNLETDHVLTVGLTPNRVDAASHLGVARDLRAVLHNNKEWSVQYANLSAVQLPDVSAFESNNQQIEIDIKVENTVACPRYMGVTLTGIEIKESPEWLKNRLKSIGVNPINNVVDVTNYVLHELGQPLHAFDMAAIKGNRVVVRNAEEGTLFTTLDGVTRKLNNNDVVICNASEPMCLAGVFGGQLSGVKPSTTAIFLESAYFSPDGVRKTAQRHGLKTDASFRYERGTDPEILSLALKRAALLIKEVAGGIINSSIKEVYPEKLVPFRMEVRYEHLRKLIGVEMNKEVIASILQDLEISLEDTSEEGFTAVVPRYRVDVQREADLVEEIVRIYGFDHIETAPVLGSAYLAGYSGQNAEALIDCLADLLVGSGFYEIMTNSLTNPSYSNDLDEFSSEENVKVLNPLSEELSVLRRTMLFSGLETIRYNLNRRQKDLRLFEFGKTYRKKGEGANAGDYSEEQVLAVYLTGNRHPESWLISAEHITFFDLALIVQKLTERAGMVSFEQKEVESSLFTQFVAYVFGKTILAKMGLVSPQLLKAFDIKQPVWYAEIYPEALLKKQAKNLTYKEVPRFPKVRRDLSLVLDKKVQYDHIVKLARRTEKEILADMQVFDVYEGDKIEQGKKAYAISFDLVDTEQTLTDQQIEKTMERLLAAFEKELGAIVRK